MSKGDNFSVLSPNIVSPHTNPTSQKVGFVFHYIGLINSLTSHFDFYDI